jgi:magnesium chelatase subunit I
MSITAFENLISTAERRLLITGDSNSTLRMSDFMGIIPAINGKIELVYEGEQEGAEQISYHLISESIKTLFTDYFPKIEKLEKEDEVGPYDKILEWFFKDNELFLEDTLSNREYQDSLTLIPGIDEVLNSNLNDLTKEDRYFMMEFLLWGLEANKKLNKYRTLEGFQFKDSLGSYISGL